MEKLYKKFGRFVPKGSVIFNEGEAGYEMYIIHEGKVKIIKKVRAIETTLAELGKGDFFGEMAILEKSPRSATVVAMTDLKLLVIDEKTFDHIIRRNTDVAIRIMKQMALRIRHTDQRIETLLFKDTTSKVVDMVSKLASQKGTETKEGVALKISISDLSGRVGLEMDKTKSVIENLTAKEFLRMDGETLIIRDLESFKKILDYIELREQLGDII
jgi:CRP/FNR family cyclic AMP-dependent transcriptional regulator